MMKNTQLTLQRAVYCNVVKPRARTGELLADQKGRNAGGQPGRRCLDLWQPNDDRVAP